LLTPHSMITLNYNNKIVNIQYIFYSLQHKIIYYYTCIYSAKAVIWEATTHIKNRKLKKTWYKQVLTEQGCRDRVKLAFPWTYFWPTCHTV